MTHPLKTLFVIADGSRARWVRRSETADDFVTVEEMKAGDAGDDDPQGQHAHGNEPETAHKARRAAFAREVAAALNAQAGRQGFIRLAVVAPAHTLGDIKGGLNTTTRALLAGELAKDLTKVPDHELATWLRPLEIG